ncbi:MAG: NfeD family protein [Eubacterium sp.]|nr:NfeD family protein [Eubacterium sp.]
MEYMLWIWLGAFILFVAFELISLGLTSIWFAIGSLAGGLVCFLGGNLFLQIGVFFAVTIGVLVLIRPYAVKYINNKAEKTNVEAIVGKTAKVTERIDNIAATGRVLVDGMEWSARTAKDQPIEEENLVTVKSVKGVKLIVEKKKS